jgi:hypothetical protein
MEQAAEDPHKLELLQELIIKDRKNKPDGQNIEEVVVACERYQDLHHYLENPTI